MQAKKYTYIDDFFARKADEINSHFSKYISQGLSKKLFRGSTAMDIFTVAIRDYFKILNTELTKELEEYKYKNMFQNSIDSYKTNIENTKLEILKYLDKRLNNLVRAKGAKDFIFDFLNREVNNSIKEWHFIADKNSETLFGKLKKLLLNLLQVSLNIKIL